MTCRQLALALGASAALCFGAACRTDAPRVEDRLSPEEPTAALQPAASPVPVQESEADREFRSLLAGLGIRLLPGENLEVSGRVNRRLGAVGAFASAASGKGQDALVLLDCIPSGLHAGLLALDLDPAPASAPVSIELRWCDPDGVEHRAQAEDWLRAEGDGRSISRGPWLFTGSFLESDPDRGETAAFAADRTGILATIRAEPSSILQLGRIEGAEGGTCLAREQAVPAVGTPITAVFRPRE